MPFKGQVDVPQKLHCRRGPMKNFVVQLHFYEQNVLPLLKLTANRQTEMLTAWGSSIPEKHAQSKHNWTNIIHDDDQTSRLSNINAVWSRQHISQNWWHNLRFIPASELSIKLVMSGCKWCSPSSTRMEFQNLHQDKKMHQFSQGLC